MANKNIDHLWVLVNHVLDDKIDFKLVLPGLLKYYPGCFKCIAGLLKEASNNDIILEQFANN